MASLGRTSPPFKMRSSTMQMPSLQNLRKRQPMLRRGPMQLPSATYPPSRMPGFGGGGKGR